MKSYPRKIEELEEKINQLLNQGDNEYKLRIYPANVLAKYGKPGGDYLAVMQGINTQEIKTQWLTIEQVTKRLPDIASRLSQETIIFGIKLEQDLF